MAFTPKDWTDGASVLNEAELERIEAGVAQAHTLAEDAKASALEALANAGEGGVAPLVIYPTGAPTADQGSDGQYGVDGDSASATCGEVFLKSGGAWTATGFNMRGPEGTPGAAGADAETWLPMYFHIDGEIQPTTDALGLPAPFAMTARKFVARLRRAPETGPIELDPKVDGVALFTEATRPVLELGSRTVTATLSTAIAENAIVTLDVVSTGGPGSSGSSATPTINATTADVAVQNSGASTTETSFVGSLPSGWQEGDTLDRVVMSGKQITSVPAGWTKVDEERDDAAFDVCWFTLMRKTATATEGTAAQTVGFAGGCPYVAATYRVPATSGGPGTGYTSTGHGTTGTTSATTPTLTTNGPNRLGIFVAGARQSAGVSTGIDTSTFPGVGNTLIASAKTATTGVNFALAIGTQAVPTATTVPAKTVSVNAGTGSNARWVTASYSFLPGTGTTTAGETLAAYLMCTKDPA